MSFPFVAAYVQELSEDDGVPSYSFKQQHDTEVKIRACSAELAEMSGGEIRRFARLWRRSHAQYCMDNITSAIPAGYESQAAPWIVFWLVQSLDLLGAMERLTDEQVVALAARIDMCQHPRGGYGNSHDNLAHLLPSYAAVASLVILGDEWERRQLSGRDPRATVNLKNLVAFLRRVRDPVTGAFAAHEDGEADVRTTYCALAILHMSARTDAFDLSDTARFVASCQTHEGGFGGVPGNEAHGGYAFCGTAALALMGALELVDVKRLMRWTVRRQMRLEGGFQGRVNKLVDACYSYWVGAIMAIVHPTSSEVSSFDWAFDRLRLQEYLLASSQCGTGGMRDKPPMRSDMYHTCYALAGLSIAQNASDCQVLGVTENALVPINPVLNLVDRRVESAQRFFLA